jgi:hypothetical protein
MPHFTAWYRREDWLRIREIMDDGGQFPLNFDEWEKTAKRQLADTKSQGIIIKPVTLDPDEFLAFCNANGTSCSGEMRGKFVIDRGVAKSKKA